MVIRSPERMGASLTGVWAGILPTQSGLSWSKLLPQNNKGRRKCNACRSTVPSAGFSNVRVAFVFFGLISSGHSCSKFWGLLRFLSHSPSLLPRVPQTMRRLGCSKVIPKFAFTLRMKNNQHVVNVMGMGHLQNGPS